MFSKIALFTALAALVAATPVPTDGGNCNTGSVQCCNQVHETGTASHALISSILGLNLQGITGSIGAQCSPLTVVGLGQGASCTQQPVCCSNNDFSGLVVVGCTPIKI